MKRDARRKARLARLREAERRIVAELETATDPLRIWKLRKRLDEYQQSFAALGGPGFLREIVVPDDEPPPGVSREDEPPPAKTKRKWLKWL